MSRWIHPDERIQQRRRGYRWWLFAVVGSALSVGLLPAPSALGDTEITPPAYSIAWNPVGQNQDVSFELESCGDADCPEAGYLTVSRNGAVIATSDTTTWEQGNEGLYGGIAQVPGGHQEGDVASLYVDGSEVGTATYSAEPTVTSGACGSTTVTGTTGPYTHIVATMTTGTIDGGNDAPATVSGGTYSASLPAPLDPNNGVTIQGWVLTTGPSGDDIYVFSNLDVYNPCTDQTDPQSPPPDTPPTTPSDSTPTPPGCPQSRPGGVPIFCFEGTMPPVAQSDTMKVKRKAGGINVLSNDIDPMGHALRVVSWTRPRYGTTKCTRSRCTYRPGKRYPGHDSFSYTITNNHGGSKARVFVRAHAFPRRAAAAYTPSAGTASRPAAQAAKHKYHYRTSVDGATLGMSLNGVTYARTVSAGLTARWVSNGSHVSFLTAGALPVVPNNPYFACGGVSPGELMLSSICTNFYGVLPLLSKDHTSGHLDATLQIMAVTKGYQIDQCTNYGACTVTKTMPEAMMPLWVGTMTMHIYRDGVQAISVKGTFGDVRIPFPKFGHKYGLRSFALTFHKLAAGWGPPVVPGWSKQGKF